MLPNFIIVGAEKAGTTTLASTLSAHPEVFISSPKEPRFFTHHNWDKGLAWYEELFKDATSYKAIGEASPAYTWAPDSRETPKRIYEALGEIKYIYIVRDPIERMISHYRHALICRWIPAGTSFEKAVELIPALKNCSRYYFQIEQYLLYTKKEQWLVLSLEDLTNHHQPALDEVFDFLDVSRFEVGQLAMKNSSENRARSSTIVELLRPIKPLLPSSLLSVKKAIVKRLEKKIEKPKLGEDILKQLQIEFEADIIRLEEFSRKSLSENWYSSENQ
jgi:hypothetical protein